MPFGALKSPIHDQFTELQRKIQLLEGDKAAHYEKSQCAIQRNSETIRQLRQNNKRLYQKLAETNTGDEIIIRMAFGSRGPEREAFRNMSGKAAEEALQLKVLNKRKRLDALKHATRTQQRRLEELQLEYQRVKKAAGARAKHCDARTRKKEEDAMKMRSLENSLEKMHFKCNEAENIIVNYQKLRSHLQEESLTYQGQLDRLEAELLKYRAELNSVQSINSNALQSKEEAKAELQEQEDLLYRERKERERVIASYRRKVEEYKARAEKVDRRRPVMQPDEQSSEVLRSSPTLTGEEEKVISVYEEAFKRIKEATGVTDIQEIVQRFISQKETHQHLVRLKEENEKALQQLKEQVKLLADEFQDMKYSGETKVTADKQVLEEQEQRLQVAEQRLDASREVLDRLVKVLSAVRAGAEHLVDKLHHVSPSEEPAAEVPPDLDEFVPVLLCLCEKKLRLLHDELQGTDVAAILKEMEEEEFLVRIEGKLPTYNTRVKLPEDQQVDASSEESDEDEADIITRDALKRQSRLIVDSKSKKKPWKKKGKF
ncbi:outer dynein arm-docking complex subunit 3-like isoform X2 [Nelusetta ayraudi]|uniref:outer dynein arm-docking complex subunit 3-like isoform X2 n=1 Tax=Nelusetta ayraudi TaxID=303726 RepID=UPI003F7012D9